MSNQEIADKYAGEACQVYTLAGIKDAIICGRLCQFASIKSLDGSIAFQVNWQTVERKMQSDKLFYAC